MAEQLTNAEKWELGEYDYFQEFCEVCEEETTNRHVYSDSGNPHGLIVCTECGEGYDLEPLTEVE